MIAVTLAALAGLVPAVWTPRSRGRLPRTERRTLPSNVVVTLISLAVALIGGSVVLGVLCMAAASAWSPARSFLSQRRTERAVTAAWPDALEVMSLALSVGMPVEAMIDFLYRSGPTELRDTFGRVRAALGAGATRREALVLLVEHGGASVTQVVDVLIAADRDGAPVALVLDRLTTEASRAHRLAAEERARRAPVLMLAPLTLCSLPSVLVGTVAPFVLLTFGQTSF